MTDLIFAIWFAGVACRLLAVVRIAKRSMAARYWAVSLYFAVCVAHSAIRFVLVRGYPQTLALDRDFYAKSAPFILAAMGLAIVSVFRSLTEAYPNFRLMGTAILGLLTVLGTEASVAAGGLLVPDRLGRMGSVLLTERNVQLVMAIVLAGSAWMIAWMRELPVRPGVLAASRLLCLEVGCGVAASAFTVATGHRFPTLYGLFSVIGGLATAALWAFYFPRTSDECPPVPQPDLGEYDEVSIQQERVLATLPGLKRALWRSGAVRQ